MKLKPEEGSNDLQYNNIECLKKMLLACNWSIGFHHQVENRQCGKEEGGGGDETIGGAIGQNGDGVGRRD